MISDKHKPKKNILFSLSTNLTNSFNSQEFINLRQVNPIKYLIIPLGLYVVDEIQLFLLPPLHIINSITINTYLCEHITVSSTNYQPKNIIILLAMVENLKSQASKSLKSILKKVQEQDRGNTLHNKQQLIQQFTSQCDVTQKVLVKMMMGSKGNNEITLEELKTIIKKLLNQIQLDQNQFKPEVNKKVQKALLKKEIIKQKFSEPAVDNNPEYYRIDYELCTQLFNIYKQSDKDPQINLLSFQDQFKYNDSLTYHKIIFMLKEANIPLDITQKLHLLRSIRKHSFNQNYISREEFVKVFKFIVHGLGVKEIELWKLAKQKLINSSSKTKEKERQKSNNKKSQRRYLRLKTDITMQGIQSIKMRNQTNKTEIVGEGDNKKLKLKQKPKTLSNSYEEASYLSKAIEKKKVGKITWESLFKMTEADKNPQIVIPTFIRRDFHQ